MEPAAVVATDSVSLEFRNSGGTYLARLDVRPTARPDGTLVVNTQLELLVRAEGGNGAEWHELTVAGAVDEFAHGEKACVGGVGVSLGDRSAHIEISWVGERHGESGVSLTDVTANLSDRVLG